MGKLLAVVVASVLLGCPAAGVEEPNGADAGVEVDSGPEPIADAGPLEPLGNGVQTLAGADQPGKQDGPRNVARFNNPVNVAASAAGDVYVADFDNGLIRIVAADGYVTTLTQQEGFRRPFGLTLATDGTLYAQTDLDDLGGHGDDNSTIWEVDTKTGAATVIAREVGRPRGLLALPDGRLLLPDMIRHDVRILDPASGEISPLAGVAGQPGYADGSGTSARFNRPYDAVLAGDGTVLIADRDNHRIRRLTLDGEVTTIAGTGVAGSSDGDAMSASFNAPAALAIDSAGVLYVTDTGNYLVRAISPDGQVTTIAGDGVAGFRDGPPLEAQFFGLEGLAVTSDGSLLYAADGNRGSDAPYHRIRRLTIELGPTELSARAWPHRAQRSSLAPPSPALEPASQPQRSSRRLSPSARSLAACVHHRSAKTTCPTRPRWLWRRRRVSWAKCRSSPTTWPAKRTTCYPARSSRASTSS